MRSSFDEIDTLAVPPGPGDPPAGPDRPAGPWSFFRTRGLDRSSLVLWPTAASPLTGPLLDDVLLGVDEDADVIWAVELMADGLPLAADADSSAALADSRRTRSRAFKWIPSTTLPEHWHPYRIEPRDGGTRRLFIQGRVADPPALRRGPRSPLIGGAPDMPGGQPPAGDGHELEVTTVPYQGVRLERRYVLARGTEDRPVLWRRAAASRSSPDQPRTCGSTCSGRPRATGGAGSDGVPGERVVCAQDDQMGSAPAPLIRRKPTVSSDRAQRGRPTARGASRSR